MIITNSKRLIIHNIQGVVPDANLLWTWIDVFRFAKQSGVGIVSPVGGSTAGGWDNDEAGSRVLELFAAALAML